MKTLRFAVVVLAAAALAACSAESPTASAPSDRPAQESSIMGTGA